MLSVIVVSRNRPALLRNCLESVICSSRSNLEIFVGYDLDDEITKSIGKEYGCKLLGAQRSNNRHESLLNPLALRACGDFIMGLNDDAEIRTQNFSGVICDTMEAYLKDKPDRIAYGRAQEKWPTPNVKEPWEAHLGYRYACYPILSREVVHTLGYFMPPNVSGPGADIKFAEIFHKICKDRMVDVPVEIYDSVCDIKEPHSHYNGYSPNDLRRDVNRINEVIERRS